ncbi:unnamed protein product [Phaeothamnion confervicola]
MKFNLPFRWRFSRPDFPRRSRRQGAARDRGTLRGAGGAERIFKKRMTELLSGWQDAIELLSLAEKWNLADLVAADEQFDPPLFPWSYLISKVNRSRSLMPYSAPTTASCLSSPMWRCFPGRSVKKAHLLADEGGGDDGGSDALLACSVANHGGTSL